MAFNFVWQNKPNKIKRKTLIADYENGGLRMLDISSFVKAQKVMWVKRLSTKDKASWKAIPNYYYSKLLGVNTWKCNLICKIQPTYLPDFYWKVVKYWSEVKQLNDSPLTPFDIRRECLWLNKNIKLNKDEIYWEDWHKQGINLIHDIVNSEGKFLTVNELEQKYVIKCDMLKYNSLKDAIPTEWRKKIKTMKINDNAISFQEILTVKIGKHTKPISLIQNREIYGEFIKAKQIEPIIKTQMQQVLDIEENQWTDIFTVPKVIQDTKIRSFQYKILFNLIPCNLYLKRINKSETDLCPFCPELDDLIHYFLECPETYRFWTSFKNWWRGLTGGDDININRTNILVGFLNKHKRRDTLNACTLLAKWHIYKSKLDQSLPFFYKFLCKLKYTLLIEKTIALKNNRLYTYDNKWREVENYIT
jgi:hypothetical protein